MYAATGGQPGADPGAAAGGEGQPSGDAGSEDGDVSDVEFEEVDDSKK